MLLLFLAYNNLDDVYNWKYLDIDQIREEYPHILQVFKSSRFPPDILQGISNALDDFGDSPLIVRSSSLLEDRMGAAFSGKYKSLFLANQGDRARRLAALLDALAEVYASIFSPDPIQYRAERGLLDQHEEMGIIDVYVIGSTRSGTAGPDADIDLIVHFRGTPAMKHELELWFEGWSLALAEMNYLRTGYKRKTLLDIRFITNEDISRQTGFAAKIGAATDPARCLTFGQS